VNNCRSGQQEDLETHTSVKVCPHEMEANCVNLFGDISIKIKYIYIFQVMFQRRVQNNEGFFPTWLERAIDPYTRESLK
jgi:hypothetical protein